MDFPSHTGHTEHIPHLLVGLVRRVEADDPDDVDYRVDTACGLDRNVTLTTSDRAQVRCPGCWTAAEDADVKAEDRTDPSVKTTAHAVRDAMVGLARLWEDTATDLVEAIKQGASRSVVEVEILRQCAAEMRTTLRSPRLGAQPASTRSTPGVDPLGHVVVGDPDPTPNRRRARCGRPRYSDGWGPVCTRLSHPDKWRHIAGDSREVVAVWDVKPGSDTDALREAARRLRAGANVSETPPTALVAGLRNAADTFDAWADESRRDGQPHPYVIAAMARAILADGGVDVRTPGDADS